MRIALLTDMHIGYTGESRWHNRKMWTEAPEITREAVAQVNTLKADYVVVLGDLTESGQPSEVEQAYAALQPLSAPWAILPGNHDRSALESGVLRDTFADHLLPAYQNLDGIGLLFLPERWPRDEKHVPRMDWGRLSPEIEQILLSPPAVLIVFSHYSVLPEDAHAEANHGLYAGHWGDGEQFLGLLRPALEGRIICLCGHQHWHHVMAQNGVLQCTTASLIEYPMETRLVTVTPERIQIETLPTASPSIAQASLDETRWVSGTHRDRVFDQQIPFSITE